MGKGKKFREQKNRTPKPSELLGKTTSEAEAVVETPVAEAKPEETPVAEAKPEETPVAEAKPEETPVAEAKPEVAEPKESPSLEDIVANLPPEIRGKAQEQLGKLMNQATKNEQAKKYASFNNTLMDKENGIAKWLEDLAKTNGVSLAGRLIKIAYPEGDNVIPSVSNTPKGKGKGNDGNGGREGFPGSWGKAELVKEGKVVQTEKSPSALAKTLGLQITGQRNMITVFESPQEADTKAELEKIYTVDAVKGEHFRVIVK